jgi:hypothetical protein
MAALLACEDHTPNAAPLSLPKSEKPCASAVNPTTSWVAVSAARASRSTDHFPGVSRILAGATFSGLTKLRADAVAEVLGENRTIKPAGNSFQDDFVGWGVHLYKIP